MNAVTAGSQSEFPYPTTRYSGSKRRLLPWLWTHFKSLTFESVLDVFGGTASVSLLFKVHGKQVHFNDILCSSQTIGRALIENNGTIVTDEEVEFVSKAHGRCYPSFIQDEFRGIYFQDDENKWLDHAVTNIGAIADVYKRSIILSAVYQACLAKRPYNLFHRANLGMRLAQVNRGFGNKATWDKPFPELVRRYVHEYNAAIFSNGKINRVIGGYNALDMPTNADLVYLDPPYFSDKYSSGTDYLNFYHFLEGINDYGNWPNRIDRSKKHKPIGDVVGAQQFISRNHIYESFEEMLCNYQHSQIALSYRADGIPTANEIKEILSGYDKRVSVYSVTQKYALSHKSTQELLFVAV